jgi:hypothetical protein
MDSGKLQAKKKAPVKGCLSPGAPVFSRPLHLAFLLFRVRLPKLKEELYHILGESASCLFREGRPSGASPMRVEARKRGVEEGARREWPPGVAWAWYPDGGGTKE